MWNDECSKMKVRGSQNEGKMVPKWLQEGCPEASWRALAADVDFSSILGSILEAEMAPKMDEMSLKFQPKSKQDFEVAF